MAEETPTQVGPANGGKSQTEGGRGGLTASKTRLLLFRLTP